MKKAYSDLAKLARFAIAGIVSLIIATPTFLALSAHA